MSTQRSPFWELASLWPAVAAVVLLAWVADSTLLVGVSAALAFVVAGVLAWWYARQPVDQWGER